jgi:hypothetical protein
MFFSHKTGKEDSKKLPAEFKIPFSLSFDLRRPLVGEGRGEAVVRASV